MFRSSLRELKNTYNLAAIVILIALYCVLEAFTSFEVAGLKFNFAFIVHAAIGMLFGPSVAMIAGIPCDLLPAFFASKSIILPAYTLMSMLYGCVYGVFLYKLQWDRKATKSKRAKEIAMVSLARLTIIVLCNIVLNTLLNWHYGFAPQGTGFQAYLTIRVIKNFTEFPFDIIIMVLLLPAIKKAYTLAKPSKRPN